MSGSGHSLMFGNGHLAAPLSSYRNVCVASHLCFVAAAIDVAFDGAAFQVDCCCACGVKDANKGSIRFLTLRVLGNGYLSA